MRSNPQWHALVALGLTSILVTACGDHAVLHPTFPDGGLLAGADPLPDSAATWLHGNYRLSGPTEQFGDSVSVSSAPGTVSFFGTTNDVYAVLHAGCLDSASRLVLEGSYRFATSSTTGLVRLFVEPVDAAQALCAGIAPSGAVRLSGTIGDGAATPETPLSLDFDQPLRSTDDRFYIVAHRGGCRTDEDCGASENSLEVIRMAQSFGADSIEVDVHLTADGIPLIYHDDDFNSRLVEGAYCRGPVGDFTLAHVRALCRLKFGEQVPTLEDVLRTVVDETTLAGLWLDVKSEAALPATIAFVHQYEARAAALGRTFQAVLGLYSEEMVNAYIGLVDADPALKARCLVELDPSDVRSASCDVWAPRWTRGPMADKVHNMQAKGKLVAFWTIDELEFLTLFLEDAKPNAILTNRPGLVFNQFQLIGTVPDGPVTP
jgi:glycerophosphoryl diester phosphodiesterase